MLTGGRENLTPLSESFDCQFDYEEGNGASEKDGKGKRVLKKGRYQLVEYHTLPGYLRDNEFILGYYRSGWPLKQIFLSIFSLHNETLNVWTHLIGFFIFLCLTVYTAVKIPKVIDLHSLQQLSDTLKGTDLNKIRAELLKCIPSLPNMADFHRLGDELRTSLPSMDLFSSLSGWHVLELITNCLPERFTITGQANDFALRNIEDNMVMVQPITRWPFFTFLGGAMFCLLASSTCHLLACHSARLSYIMLRVDYAGIAALIATSFYPLVYYSFLCNPFLCYLYLGSITILGFSTIVFSLFPVFEKSHFRRFRAALFFAMGMSGVVPVIHKLILYGSQPEALQTTGCEVLMGVLYGIGALVYAMRIPERWKPGKFDIAGHSHQFFHVFVVAGAFTHYQAGLIYLKWRDRMGC